MNWELLMYLQMIIISYIMGGGKAKTLQGDVNVADDLIINTGNELNLGNNTITSLGIFRYRWSIRF